MHLPAFALMSLVLVSVAAWADDAPSTPPAAPAAPAAPARPPARGHGACKPDVAKFCAEVKPGRGAILACLDGHKDELSAGCKTMLERMRARRAGADKPADAKDGAAEGQQHGETK
jgi:Cysteine rich repeat